MFKMPASTKTIWTPTIIVFVTTMLIVVTTYILASRAQNNEINNTVVDYTHNIESAVRSRLYAFDESLHASVGFLAGSEFVSKEEWRVFTESSNILNRYPGAQGIGYAEVISDNDKNQFIQNSRVYLEDSFSIFPIENSENYVVVTYIEPFDDNNKLIGYNLYSNEIQKAAILSAAEDESITLSETIGLEPLVLKNEQIDFILYAPYFGENLNKNIATLEGIVFAIFDGEAFFENATINELQDNLAFKIAFNSNQAEIYSSENYEEILGNQERKQTVKQVEINGTSFTFEYVYIPSQIFSSALFYRPSFFVVLGTMVAVLLAGVTWLQLRSKANDMLLAKERETNEAKDSLLSIASHQLRTPATGVKQYLGLVLQGFAGDLPPSQEKLLIKANQSNERQLKTINDILYLARIDSGRIVLSKKTIILQSIVDSILDELKEQIAQNRHKIKRIMPKTPIKIAADEHMLRMALENLVTNAIKYTKEKGRITIRVSRSKDNAVFTITDNGVGIAEEDADKLFKEFSRIQNELSQTVSGTGIGLYLAKHLVELHKGRVECVSELGKGSTFIVTLPIKK